MVLYEAMDTKRMWRQKITGWTMKLLEIEGDPGEEVESWERNTQQKTAGSTSKQGKRRMARAKQKVLLIYLRSGYALSFQLYPLSQLCFLAPDRHPHLCKVQLEVWFTDCTNAVSGTKVTFQSNL